MADRKTGAEIMTDESSIEGSNKFKLMVHKIGDDKAPAIQVSVNGKMYHIKKGVEVIVPESVVEVLRNATKAVYEQEDGHIIGTEMPSYPFSATPV